ncbi:MAG: hypothetical protein AB8H80_02040 [Planctomycetota bacterium]
MNKIALLLLLLLAASIAVALYAFQSSTWTPTHAPLEGRGKLPAGRHATRHSGSLAAGGQEEPATAHAPTARTRAPSQNTRAYPKHATWVEVQLLDPDGEPVPDAEVLWFDDGGRAAARSTAGAERWTLLLNHELLAERFGWRTTTDELGIARVARKGEVVVLARTGLLRGDRDISANTPANPEGRITIEMRRSKRIDIHVAHADGAPAAGVPLTIASLDPEGNDTSAIDGFPITISDSQGKATIGDLWHWRHALLQHIDQEHAGRLRRIFVKASLPHVEGAGVEVPFANEASTDVLELVLPPLSAVRVGVDLGTHTNWAKGLPVTLMNPTTIESSRPLIEEIDADGWAHFAHIPLAEQLLASAGGIAKLFVSSSHSGETTQVTLTPKPDSLYLLLRVLAPNGKPSTYQHYQLSGSLDGRAFKRMMTTDYQGRAVIEIEDVSTSTSAGRATLELRNFRIDLPNSEELGAGILPPLDLAAGCFDVGDVPLELPDLFAAGRVTDARQQPFLQALDLSLERQSHAANGDEPARWHPVNDAVITLEDGVFTVCFEPSPGDDSDRYRLQAIGEDVLPGAATPLQPGDKDVVVEIQRGSSLSLNVRLAERVQTQFVICQLFPPPGRLEPALAQRLKTNPASIGEDRYEVVWRGVPDGRYRLELRLWGDPAPLLQLDDVRLTKAGGLAHEALHGTIDLRDIVQVTTLNLLEMGTDGTAVPLAKGPNQPQGALARLSNLTQSPMQAIPINDPATRLLVRRNSEPLVALVEGYQPSPVLGSGPSRTATLAPWPKLAMRLTISTEDLSPVKLPGNTVVEARALPAAPERRQWQTPWWQGPLAPLTGSREEWVRVRFAPNSATAVAQLPIGERGHNLELRVRHQQQSARLLDAPYPVSASSGDIQIDLPKARWQRALGTISRDER